MYRSLFIIQSFGKNRTGYPRAYYGNGVRCLRYPDVLTEFVLLDIFTLDECEDFLRGKGMVINDNIKAVELPLIEETVVLFFNHDEKLDSIEKVVRIHDSM